MNNESTRKLTSSGSGPPPNLSLDQLAHYLILLVASKPTMEPLSLLQTEIWYQALKEFPSEVVKFSVAELALSAEAFVNLGQVFTACRRRVPKQYSPHGSGQDAGSATKSDIRAFAESLGIK